MAHRRGREDAEISRADVAQADQRQREVATSRKAIRNRRDRETGHRIDGLQSRLSMLGGGLDPHSDPRIVGAALGALGIGLEALGGSIRRIDED